MQGSSLRHHEESSADIVCAQCTLCPYVHKLTEGFQMGQNKCNLVENLDLTFGIAIYKSDRRPAIATCSIHNSYFGTWESVI